ncbi:Alpha/Beta hydrolase protein, partial [Mycena leptocephala]
TPSQDLEWVQCYSIFQCTRLEARSVPLDYSDPSVGNAALAVIRLAANSSPADYRGPILFNPGGPGGSGVDTLVASGPSFEVILGSKQYDLVSFDPRGVSYSTPIASFFETDAERALWNIASVPESLNASSDAIPHAWGRARLLGQLAAQRDMSGILKYMTTDNVARDMLRITQKFGFEKLKYYGISYGTVLGATFAALFPDKVERILIDGVVDADAWLNANLTIEATDTDKALQAFFDGCVAAGPDVCAFYKPTAAEIAGRLSTLTDSVRAQPVPAITTTGYGLVDYSFLRSVIFGALYSPYTTFAPLAEGLATLENGNGTVLYSLSQQSPFQCDCTNDTAPFHLNGMEARIAVECGDAVEVKDSIQQLADFYENAAKTSQFAEFSVGENRVSCSGWQVYREDRFKGPVTAANTSFPLLLVSTSADPVAPMAAALKVQAGFPGSVLFTQDSPGHTSTSAPSLCTINHFRQYFLNGTLPAPGTVCPV